MWPAVHPDLPLLFHPLDLRVDLDQLLGRVIDVGPDAEETDAAEPVRGRVRDALPFRQRQDFSVPGVRLHARGVRDWKSKVVANGGTGNTFFLVFRKQRVPVSREI